jgi:4-amino-4-deoxy-L-arabinose transferase-like glycosyltransferase
MTLVPSTVQQATRVESPDSSVLPLGNPKRVAPGVRSHYLLCAVGAGILIIATVVLFFVNLGSSSVSLSSDEVIYVRMTQGVVQTGELFPLRHGSAPSFEKPPLKFWLTAALPVLFGESNWTYRLFDGSLGVLAIALAALVTYRLSLSLPAALIVGLLLLGAPEWVIAQHGFRRVVLDGLLTVFTLLAALSAWSWCTRSPSRKTVLMVSALCSLAILTKSVAGFVPLMCACITLIICGTRRPSLKEVTLLILPPLLTFVAYVVCVWLAGGWKGLNSFLGVEILTRAFSGFEGHNSDKPLFYAWYILRRAAVAPRSLLIAGVIGILLTVRQEREARFLVIWGALPVVAYSFSTSKAPWYLNPFMPFICMIAVLGTTSLLRILRNSSASRVGGVALAFLLSITATASYSRAFTRAVSEVLADTERIPLDLMSEKLRNEFEHIALQNGAISGRTSPIRGRFNIEGIYRGMMNPKLTVIESAADAPRDSTTATLVREESLKGLPEGWQEIGRIPPFGARTWWLIAVTYPSVSINGASEAIPHH